MTLKEILNKLISGGYFEIEDAESDILALLPTEQRIIEIIVDTNYKTYIEKGVWGAHYLAKAIHAEMVRKVKG